MYALASRSDLLYDEDSYTPFTLGSVQISYHAREGGRGEISPMCDKNIITLNLGDFCTKNNENAIKIWNCLNKIGLKNTLKNRFAEQVGSLHSQKRIGWTHVYV